MFSLPYLLRRLGRQRLVSVDVLLGIVLAVALGVAAPLATDALASLGLRATLDALPPAGHNLQLVRPLVPFFPPVQQYIRQQLGDLIAGDYTASYLPQMQARRATPILETPVRLATQGGLLKHSMLTAGRAPRPTSARASQPLPAGCDANGGAVSAPVEALLSAEQLKATSLAVGDQLCIANLLPATIAGSFVSTDPRDPYWFDDRRPLLGESAGGEPVAVLMLDEDDFNTVWLRLFGGRTVTHFYRGFVRDSAINLDTLDAVAGRLDQFRADLTTMQPAPGLTTGLDTAIATFKTRLLLLQPALGALLLMLLILAVIYVVLVGALVTQRQSAEIALLGSRGASSRQVLFAQVGQALLLAAPGFALGLGLGTLAVLALSRTALFQGLRGGAGFQLHWTPTTWLLPGATLLATSFGLIFATRPALAHSQVTLSMERARPPQPTSWRRLPLDGLLTLLAGWGVWQLWRAGSGLTTTLEGTLRFNLLALATPVILLIAGALLLLRLFPLAVHGLGGVLGRRGIVSALGAWQLARNPLSYSRLALLLTLTVGLGVYSQATTGAIARSQLRQALDMAGADVRIPLAASDDPAALLAAMPAAAHTLLTGVDAEVVAPRPGSATVLGVDGPALSAVLAGSGSDDATLLKQLRQLRAGAAPLGLALPAGSQALTVRVKGDVRVVTVYAKFGGSNGERLVALGQPGGDWQRLEAPIPADLQPPHTLQALIAMPDPHSPNPGGQQLVFDQLATRAGNSYVALSSAGRLDAWEGLTFGSEEAHVSMDQGGAIQIDFGELTPGHWAALRWRAPASIPVYAAQAGGLQINPGQRLGLRIGGQTVDAVVEQRTGRLPGVDDQQPVLLADQTRLAAVLTYGLPTTLRPTELRVALRPGSSPPANPAASTKAAALRLQTADPLSNGVRVVLLLGFGCALVLSLIGFLTYSGLTIQARRLDWAVLSTIGLSPRQLLALIAAEQGFVLGGSLLAGALLALLLAAATRPFMAVVAHSVLTTPDVVDWPGFLLLIGGLSLALAIALAGLLLDVRRRGLARVLRLGES